MYSKGRYFLLQSLVMLVSPITSFLIALRFYKSTVSQIFMLVFAFYFGMHFYLAWDISKHYVNMRMFYCDKSLTEILNNPFAMSDGLDFYHVALKYIISRFTDSREIFAGVVCVIYSSVFLFFFNQFKRFYNNFLPVSCGLLLLCVVFVVEFYWYQGVRFWLAAFFFAGFYLKYVNTGKIQFLLISTLSVLIHYTLVNIFLILDLNWVLSKFWVWFRVILFGISLFYRSLSIDFMGWIIKNVPGLDLGKRTDPNVHESLVRRVQKMRATNNIFYSHRSEAIIILGILILMILWSRKAEFSKKYLQLLFFALTLYTVSNFAYAELIFFERFMKITALMFYCFLFITACQNYEKIKGVSLILMILTSIPLSFEILTQVVEMREHLFYSELWFGNFFIKWTGGMTDAHGRW